MHQLHSVPAPLLRIVFQSTLHQVHKLPPGVWLQTTMFHIHSLPTSVARVVLQSTLPCNGLANVGITEGQTVVLQKTVHQFHKFPVPVLRMLLQCTLHQLHKLPP